MTQCVVTAAVICFGLFHAAAQAHRGDDSVSCLAEHPAEPQCGAAFTQQQIRRKAQQPGADVLLAGNSRSDSQLRAARGALEPSKQDPDPVHVAYTVSNHVMNATLRSMLTLSLHNTATKLIIHLLVPPEDVVLAEQLKRCILQRLDGSDLHGGVPEVQIASMWERPLKMEYPHNPDLNKSSMSSQGRLFLQEYLPEVSRAVYLDSDTLVLRDVSELYNLHMNSSLAAALDPNNFGGLYRKFVPRLDDHVGATTQLFNDGILLLDLDRWRKENISGALMELAESVEGAASGDQLLLNLEYQGHASRREGFDRLSWEWDVFWGAEDLEKLFDDCILHFVTSPKPWNSEAHDEFMTVLRDRWTREGDASDGECAGFDL